MGVIWPQAQEYQQPPEAGRGEEQIPPCSLQHGISPLSGFAPLIKTHLTSMTGMTQLAEHHPANQKITGLIPGQSTCLGVGQVSVWGAFGVLAGDWPG